MGQTPHFDAAQGSVSVLRDVLPRWPLVLLIGLAAAAASTIAVSRREPSYTATAKLLITPVAQYDETFLGTSLIRDAGDANRTAPTAAQMLRSAEISIESARRLGGGWTAESVREAVDVKPVSNTNLLAIRAGASEGAVAERLAAVYATSAFAVRWRTITRELADRIAALEARPGSRRNAGDLARKVGILEATRRGGRDPTLGLLGVNDAVADNQVPGLVVAVLALLGGLFLGGLAAVGIGRSGRRVRHEGDDEGTPEHLASRQRSKSGDANTPHVIADRG
jgi:capsular polysaccharide biosynthesis protein